MVSHSNGDQECESDRAAPLCESPSSQHLTNFVYHWQRQSLEVVRGDTALVIGRFSRDSKFLQFFGSHQRFPWSISGFNVDTVRHSGHNSSSGRRTIVAKRRLATILRSEPTSIELLTCKLITNQANGLNLHWFSRLHYNRQSSKFMCETCHNLDLISLKID